ncbi:MAN2A1 [Bugula neritina]|uniref:MAN2A1 n=1 Tax=Bugula neritina TaxID=10212 RepID=A0A7J7KB71_BUGNE|nr:MAN2A1 [Bugula neritina]
MLRAFITLLRARRCQVLMKLLIVAGFVLLVFIQLKSLMNHNSPQLSLHNHRFSHHADESPFPDKQKLHAADKYEPSRTSRDHVHQRPVEAGQRPLEVGQRPLEAGQGPLGVNQKQGAVSHDGERGERGGREMSDRRHADVANEQQMSHTSKVESIQEILDEAYQAGSRNRSTQANQGGSNFNKMVTVVLMPHSHNDPGWLHTYDMYYDMRTSVMFNNLVKFLSTVDKEMPFQWSESVSLLRWYKSASESSRSILKSAIKAGTVLIDHGSWSMPDEASPTLYSLVENLIIGHTWIYNEFGVKPEFSWSNDPFGHSSTIPYLLKQCGIKAMVINRIDHLLKKKLRFDQKLEFFWKIPSNGFKREGDSMFTHILPHSLYSTSQAFGSNFTLAKLYDFSPPERQYSPIVDKDTGELLVDNATLKTRASDLANQIHMRSSYYKHNVILSPIGDDFRYIDYREFEGVYRNWNYLRDFYASHPQYNVKLKLGTLADYFNLVTEYI